MKRAWDPSSNLGGAIFFVMDMIGKSRNIAGFVVFDGERFLLLHRVMNWSGWEFPKGEIESDEASEEAIARELYEEAGIKKFKIITKLDEFDYYDNSRKVNSHVTNYLLHVSSNSKVTLNNKSPKSGEIEYEHDGFKWFFPKDALKTVTHKNQRESIALAIKHLGLSE